MTTASLAVQKIITSLPKAMGMEHLHFLAAAVTDADKAYNAAHDAAWGVLDPAVKVTLDLEVRRALKALLATEDAYKKALDEHNADLGVEVTALSVKGE